MINSWGQDLLVDPSALAAKPAVLLWNEWQFIDSSGAFRLMHLRLELE